MGDGCCVAVGSKGTGVEVCVETEIGVDVDTEMGSGVDVNVGVSENAVTDGFDPPLRTILGPTHNARSPVGEPFASVRRMNLTVCPASGLKSTSA